MHTKYLTLRLFAKKVGYKRADTREFCRILRGLERTTALRVEQNGFVAHSLYHNKVVVVKDWDAVAAAFGQPYIESKTRSVKHHHIRIYQYTCAQPDLKCSSRRYLVRQGVVCTFPSTCNQKLWLGKS